MEKLLRKKTPGASSPPLLLTTDFCSVRSQVTILQLGSLPLPQALPASSFLFNQNSRHILHSAINDTPLPARSKPVILNGSIFFKTGFKTSSQKAFTLFPPF